MLSLLMLWGCLSTPDYTLSDLSNQGVEPTGIESAMNPTTDPPILEDGEQKPSTDSVVAVESRCQPLDSSLRRFPNLESEGVEVRADVTYGEVSGAMLVEIVKNDPDKGSVTVFHVTCNLVKQLSYRIPSGIGEVYAVYFIDQEGNGPSEDDLIGMSAPMDTAKASEVNHTISIQQGTSLEPLVFPFLNTQPAGTDSGGGLPPPINEPEAGLPDPIQDDGTPPPMDRDTKDSPQK